VLNDLENFRTETEYNDSLIVKTFIFQFFNSYLSCFYVAFVKGTSIALFGALGAKDEVTGKAFADMCGKREFEGQGLLDAPWLNSNPVCLNGTIVGIGATETIPDTCNMILQGTDCMDDLKTLMVSYLAIKYVYALPLELFLPMLIGFINTYMLEKSLKVVKDVRNSFSGSPRDVELVINEEKKSTLPPAVEKYHEKIEVELAEPAYGGTFAEFNTKVLQFGYIAMFSAAFPIGALTSAVANAIELKIDALKLFEVRRPRYVGAEDIGSWQKVLMCLGWIALFVNVALLSFTSFKLRDNILIPIVGNSTTCASPAQMAQDYGIESLNYTASWKSLYESGFGERFDPITQGESWAAKCESNVKQCYENVGGVPYLPAFLSQFSTWQYPAESTNYTVTFLGLGQFAGDKSDPKPGVVPQTWWNHYINLPNIDPRDPPILNASAFPRDAPGTLWQLLPTNSSTTVPYSEALCKIDPYGVGNAAVPNYLYDKSHCDVCNEWIKEVSVARLIFLMIVEHLLLFLKVFLAMIIPDKPKWVVKAEARADFAKEVVRKRGSIHVMSTEENDAFQKAKKQVFDSIVDDDATAGGVSHVSGHV